VGWQGERQGRVSAEVGNEGLNAIRRMDKGRSGKDWFLVHVVDIWTYGNV
jgi:hypothetical protein